MEPQKGKIFFWLTIFYLILIGGIIFWYWWQTKEEIENVSSQVQINLGQKEKGKIIIVALGDSLTKAVNPSKELRGDQEDYSYATGTKIKSFARLMEEEGYEVETYNLAVSGAKTQDVLDDQVSRAVKLNPDYVLMTIGGNDAMKGEDIDEVKESMREIVISFPQSRILWGNIPNLAEFREAPFGQCHKPLKEIEVLDDVGQFVEVYIKVYNRALANVVASNKGEVVDLFNLLDRGNVSEADCLHFSVSGQEKAAGEFYKRK